LEPGFNVRTCGIGKVLVVDPWVCAPGRGCVTEPQIHIDAIEDPLVLNAAAGPGRDDMGALLDPGAIDNGDSGVGESRDDVGVTVDLLGAVANLHLQSVFFRHLPSEALPVGLGRTVDL